MSDASTPLGPNEIDDLLRKAQAAASPPASTQNVLAQNELASLLGTGGARTAASEVPEGRIASADMEFLLDQAQQALESVDRPAQSDPLEGLAPFRLEEFGGAPPSADIATLELIRDVELDLRIELGRTQMHLDDVLKLHKGSVVPLDKLAGDPVDIFVNGRLIARGEVLVLNDNFCVRVAELITAEAPRAG
jgi:flagellar motor switch protein FliN/FliY